MNERIRELYEQAHDIEKNTLYFICPTIGPDVPKQVSREEEIRLFNHEKFAELIIKQCIKAASDLGDGLIKDNTWHDGVRACIWSMQDEFGLDRNFGIE